MAESMIKFRKLYESNPLDGVQGFAIVTYRKRPYWQGLVNDTPTVTQYQKALLIDFWLFVLRFYWLTKRTDLPTEDFKPSKGHEEAQGNDQA